MQIKKTELQAALEVVKPGLANKETIEQTTSFAFIDNRVVSYNDEISISFPLELEIEGAVKAEELYKFLAKLKGENVDITVNGSELLIQSGKTKAGLTLQEKVKLPLKEVAEKGKWKPLPADFLKFVGFAVSSCSKDMSRPVLTCVHINKLGFIEASDNYRITRCQLSEEMPVKTFLLTASSAIAMVKFAPVKIAEGNGWIHFKAEDGAIMSCRIYEEDFPDVSRLLSVKGQRITFPNTLRDTLDKAGVFAKRDHFLEESVTISIANKRLKVRSESDTGWFEDELHIKYEGDPITFVVTPYLLRGILDESSGCILSADRLKFEGTGWEYVGALK